MLTITTKQLEELKSMKLFRGPVMVNGCWYAEDSRLKELFPIPSDDLDEYIALGYSVEEVEKWAKNTNIRSFKIND